jgi:hypothetical protein
MEACKRAPAEKRCEQNAGRSREGELCATVPSHAAIERSPFVAAFQSEAPFVSASARLPLPDENMTSAYSPMDDVDVVAGQSQRPALPSISP